MNTYNIAFVPKLKTNEFINLATSNVHKHSNYILGPSSIPHVTICQFKYEEEDLGELYEKISREFIDYNLTLSFKAISHITFNETIYWISLLPEKTSTLHDIFACISKLVIPLRSDQYDPHLTLFNYSLKDSFKKIDFNHNINIEDDFELVIGESDSVGQLTKIVKTLSEKYDSSLRVF